MTGSQSSIHRARNLVSLAGDYIAFTVAWAFADQSTVLPAFARELTSSAPLIGLVSTIHSGGWLLPQLVAANYVAHRERKKPYIIWPLVVGRPMLLLLAAATLCWARQSPLIMLLLLYLCQAVLWICDGLASVPWFDVLAKVFPGQGRGRYLAVSQVGGGLLAVGAGVIVQRVLNPDIGLPFPQNYSLLFLLSFLFLLLSLGFLLLLEEPVESAHSERASWRKYLPMLVNTLQRDQRFALALVGRLLVGFAGMAGPFYILYGVEALALGSGVVGLCLAAQVAGRILGGLMLGYSVDKLGSHFTILGGITVTAMSPLLALLLGLFHHAVLGHFLLRFIFPAIFFLSGISLNALNWSFTNYILDIAPPKDRTTYIGLANTLGGIAIISPVLGGALLDATSFATLFGVSFAIYTAALFIARRLPTSGAESI